MSDILFPIECRACGHKYERPCREMMAGAQQRCPKCGAAFVVADNCAANLQQAFDELDEELGDLDRGGS